MTRELASSAYWLTNHSLSSKLIVRSTQRNDTPSQRAAMIARSSSFGVKHYGFSFLLCCVTSVTIVVLFSSASPSFKHRWRSSHAMANGSQVSGPTPTLKTSVQNLTVQQQCVKEVLQRLRMPLSRSYVELKRPLPRVLTIDELSETCRDFLTPKPVSKERQKELACFLPKPWFDTFKGYDRERIDSALLLIANAFQKANIPIYLDSGTALGSWRMHGQIPYDSDVDFMVLYRHKAESKAVFEKLTAMHPHLFQHYGYNFWRMDVIRADKSRLFQIDIFVHSLKEQQKVIEQVISPKYIKVDKLMPFVMRPFQGIVLPTWRNLDNYFEQMYGKNSIETCKPSGWIPSHFKISCATRTVKCSELNYFFNFAHRWKHPNGRLTEVLFNRTHVLSVFYAPDG